MKAVVYTKPGSPNDLEFKEIERPRPKAGQVLVAIKASALGNSDYMRYREWYEKGKVSFFTRFTDTVMGIKGKPLGTECAGIAVEVGEDVTDIAVGDEVFGSTELIGTFAEYAVVNAPLVCKKPSNLSFEESAAIPTCGLTALGALRKAGVKEGMNAMIYGASGGVGQFALQIAKAMGATVTAVCSTRNVETAYNMGADKVIDYKKEDFTKVGMAFDVIIGVNGYNPLKVYKKLLNDTGTYVALGGQKQGMRGAFGFLYSIGTKKKLSFFTVFTTSKQKNLPYLKEIAEAGKLKPYIERYYPIQELPEALEYAAKNGAQGKIAINVDFGS